MKILMVTMAMNIGGAETHILELCRELNRRGHEITLASFGGVYADELTALGVKNVTLPLHTKRPGAVLTAYHGLERLIRDGNFDLVHAHARIPAFICGLLHDRMKFRFVTTAHLNFSMNALWRKISRWGERVMAVSDDIADYLVKEYGYPREKIYLTINGIDTAKFSPEIPFDALLASHGLKKERRRLVYISRLDADRADPAYRLIEIAPKIAESFPDTDILVVGGGTEFETLCAMADKVNKDAGYPLVTMTGAVSNINEYASAADVFIGVSRSALEAMSAAKPVIVAGGQGAIGIFDETKTAPAVDTNFCCRGFDLADGETLFGWIADCLNRPADELAAMGEYNRAFVMEHYTAGRMAADYEEMYRAAMAAPVPFRGKADVVVSGYYGFGNMGDESLLDVIAATLAEEIPGVKIAALTRHPKADARRTGLRCVPRFSPQAVGTIAGVKLLISGGGSLLQDSTSRRSLKYYAGVLGTAEMFGVKSYIYANGIGPVRDRSNRKLTVKVVDRASEVSVRDADSADELRRLGVTREKIRVTADPAFLIRPYDEHRLARTMERIGVKDGFFAVSLRPPVQKNTDISPTHTADEAVEACVKITEKYGLVPFVIPMQTVQDGEICRYFTEKYNERMRGTGRTALLYTPENAPELIGVLSKAEFVIGMRLHAIIFASSAEVPVVGLEYDPKVASMMKALGQPFVVDLGTSSDIGGEVLSCVERIMEDREGIGRALAARAAEMRQRCREDLATARGLIQ
ncbi:MAG: polysaccharide pyruvyl transferase CsaB [Clostridia bacterium]|nr:polysaccharide pyruvyl transferase CsaB [Clostridia bacterium]